ncbi:hypothetical protein SAMN05216343_10328 [Oscillibacter sp. PC13]|uniref:hypothetical protein n=1 Tax=Oscillibacter sp. PC13 TaxID=1855299 RepID=UPI0008EB4930|nr:hypothetical protein [Oscillibacter sp. PC13]SFP09037.1 hypothetical protein SAMN05216343_10328 [Oscillibacter sp. PC13]
MENNTFKSVAFGGFDKQDVIRYIEQTAKEAAAVQERLQQENDGLRAELQTTSAQLERLRTQLTELQREHGQLQDALSREQTARQALEPAKPEAERLAAELERLRPDAEAYAQFRERIGAIECEARKRAADLEASTVARLEGMISSFQKQYQELVTTFDSTATHVTGELRKVEVNLAQLPRAMDQAGVELNELSAVLEQTKKQEK